MSNTLEDHVLNQAATKLGFDKEEPNINQGYGQNTSFKNLGYPNSHHQPDGWYIPNDKNVAIILETKRPSEEVTNPRSQGCPRFQSGEELANSVGKINACYLL